MQDLDAKIQPVKLLKAFRLMKEKKIDDAEVLLKEGLKESELESNDLLTGIYNSGLGVLYKLKKDFRKAWKFYEKAERLIPGDPSLKIISARLLVNYFGQYDTAIKKMEQVKEMVGTNLPFLHEVLTIEGLAYLKKGDKKKAVECLTQSMGQNFKDLQTAANLDFALIEALLQKGVEPDQCRDFLQKAAQFSKKNREPHFEKVIQKILSLFPPKK